MTTSCRIFLLCLLLVGEAFATVIFHQKLETVLSRGTPVVRGRVTAIALERDTSSMTVKVGVERTAVLRGECPERIELTHSYSTLLERTMPDGSMRRVSPLREGSGIETDLQVDVEYFFILDESKEGFLRAEPLESGARIRAALTTP